MTYIRKWNWTTVIPICPTFRPCFATKNDDDVNGTDDDIEIGNVTSYNNNAFTDKVRHRKTENVESDATRL